jgi:hypothetical protein
MNNGKRLRLCSSGGNVTRLSVRSIALFFGLCSGLAQAQISSATLVGTVSDSTGGI